MSKKTKAELVKENLSLRDQISVMKTEIENYKRIVNKENKENKETRLYIYDQVMGE